MQAYLSIQWLSTILRQNRDSLTTIYVHRVRKKRPPKQNAVKCTVYNIIQ